MELITAAGAVGFLAALGMWGWFLLVAVLVVGVVIAETGAFYGGGVLIVAGILFAQYVLHISVWAFLWANPLLILGYAILYVGLGGAYTAVWKWPDYLRSNSEEIKADFERAQDTKRFAFERDKAKPTPEGVEKPTKVVLITIEEFMDSSGYDKYRAKNNKALLATWTQMWIFALAWDLTHRPFIWIYEVVYDSFGRIFDIVGKRTTRNILK